MAVVSQSPFAMTLGHHQKFSVIQTQQQQPQVIVSSAAAHLGGKRPLAPAPERSSVLVAAASNDLRCKRKIQFVPYGQPPQQPASVARRNARERNRVKQVNNGFATLRQHIPPSVAAAFAPQGPTSGRGVSKKLSKVETLRLAVEYIRSLKQMIDEHEEGDLGAGVAMLASQEAALAEAEARYYGTSSPEQYQGYTTTMLSCSEASASPTPSHSSEGSFTTASTYTTAIYHQDNFENYDPKSPEDEELLDAIFSWQQNE